MGSSLVSNTESRGQQTVLTTSLIAQAVNKSTDEVATATQAVAGSIAKRTHMHACPRGVPLPISTMTPRRLERHMPLPHLLIRERH